MKLKESPRRTKKTRVAAPVPAPGELGILQAFANTLDLKTGADAISTPEKLADWMAKWHLLPADMKLTKTDVGRALDVRDGVRALVAANSGAELDEQALKRLDKAVRGARVQVRFHRDGSTRFEAEDLGGALGRLANVVAVSQLAEVWDRFKMCSNSNCRAVYYDFSNKRTTKWCTKRCGDLIRARNYRRGIRHRGW